MAEVSYEIKNRIGVLGENSNKQVNIVSWNGREPKIDIREWRTQNGEVRCGKGVAITSEEARNLVDLLTEYLNDADDDF